MYACNARRAGRGKGTDRCLFPLPRRKTTEPLRSESIRSCNSRATRLPTRQPVYKNREKIAPALMSCRSSTSRSSRRTWLRPGLPMEGL